MSDVSWEQLQRNRFDRRSLLRAATRAGIGAAGIALVGCGGDDDDDDAPAAEEPAAAAPEAQSAEEPAAEEPAEQAEEEPAVAAGPVRGGTFVEGYDRDFSKVDPVATPWADPAIVAIYEFLQVRDSNGNFVPALAESWTVSDDDLTWTFKIRQGVPFHSGREMTAEDVVLNFNIFRDPDMGQNAIFWPAVADVHLGDAPDEVVVVLNQPFIALPETIATEYSMIFNNDSRESIGADSFGATEADGTGPFTLSNFAPGDEVVVDRFDGYTGSGIPFVENPGAAYLDSVRWVPILEPGSRAPEIQTGNVHAVKNPAGQDIDNLKNDDDLVVVQFTEPSNFLFNLNQTNEALGFNDARVRQAISAAIDRDAIVDAIFFGAALATAGPIYPGWKWYEPQVEEINSFDLQRANQLLDAADVRNIEFTTINEANQAFQTEMLEAMAGMISQIDVTMKIQNLEDFFGTLLGETAPDAWMFKWLWSSPADLLIFFEAFPTAEYNGSGLNADLQQSIEDWQSAATDEDLESAARRMQIAWAEHLPHIPTVTPISTWVHDKTVRGWRPSQSMLYPFYSDVWLEA